MKNILIPFEGDHFPQETLDLVRDLNDLAPLHLTAAFVPEIDYAELFSVSAALPGMTFMPESQDEDVVITRNSEKLEEFCSANHIMLSVHKDRLDFALPLIRKETRFSDLMIMSSQHFFDNIGVSQPNAYMKQILQTTECPILLLPEKFQLPDNIVLAYDGSAASVYAIKQFAHLFPEFSATKTIFVYLNGAANERIPDRTNMEEFASACFSDVHFLHLQMDRQDFSSTWLPALGKTWLVAGSYGRSELSQLFSKSFITSLIHDHKMPLFIAHQK
jgi:hypothetical protein